MTKKEIKNKYIGKYFGLVDKKSPVLVLDIAFNNSDYSILWFFIRDGKSSYMVPVDELKPISKQLELFV